MEKGNQAERPPNWRHIVIKSRDRFCSNDVMWNTAPGHSFQGEENGRAKLTDKEAPEIKWLLENNLLTQTYIANLYDVSQPTVSHIKHGKNWNHVEAKSPKIGA